jgi:hypothetical protein
MKKFLVTLFSVLVFVGTLIPTEAQAYRAYQAYYNPLDGQWYYYYDGKWWPVQAPNTPGDTPQPPVTTGIHGYYWYPGHYGPTGVWYPGVWLAY